MGVVDPTKVVRFALQNASSVAGLLLTTDVSVAEMVEEKSGRGGPPGGHGRHGRHGRYGHVTRASARVIPAQVGIQSKEGPRASGAFSCCALPRLITRSSAAHVAITRTFVRSSKSRRSATGRAELPLINSAPLAK